MAGYRKKKLEELIKRVIGDALIKEIKDPRIGFVTIYKVELSKDYSLAEVYFSVIGDNKQKKKSIDGLIAAKGYLRYHLGKNVKLRIVPDLKFKLDESIETGVDLVNLIDSVTPKSNDNNDND
jgi:ribosome-binding factor A